MPSISRYYSSTAAKTTLSSAIDSSSASLQIAAASGLPSQYPFTLILEKDTANEEIVEVTGLVGSAYTITRGVDGTSAKSHSIGAIVEHGVSARDFAESRSHEAATSAHGVTGDVVGTGGAQTISGVKTFSGSPVIAGATISGTFTSTATISGGTLSGNTITSGTLGNALNAGGFKITNLATPTASSDAVRKDFADAQVAAAATSAASAAVSAASAAASATTAANSVATIAGYATSASNSASAAATSATSAATSATSAANSATAAATSATSADSAASIAIAQASNASASATAAATSATSAANSATSAANSASAAATSATSAATSATSAATSATSAALSYTTFNNQYLGAKSSAPTLNNSGGALVDGNLYFNTTDSTLYVRNAGAWQAAAVSTAGFATTGTNAFTAAQTVTIASGSSVALTIQNNGTGDSLIVNDTASDTTPFVIDRQGFVVAGDANPTQIGGANWLMQAVGFGTAYPLSVLGRYASATGPRLGFAKSRSTTNGTFTPVVSGDALGDNYFFGDDGTSIVGAARIGANVDGTVSTGIVPSRLTFSTASTAGAVTERMRIDSAGNVGIGKTPSYTLDVNGTVNATDLYVNGAPLSSGISLATLEEVEQQIIMGAYL